MGERPARGLSPRVAGDLRNADFDRRHRGIGRAALGPLRFFNDGDGEPELFLRRVGREYEGPSKDAARLHDADSCVRY